MTSRSRPQLTTGNPQRQSSSDIIHPLAGTRFPARVGPFVRQELTTYDEFGHDISVRYAGIETFHNTFVTVYVYPAGAKGDDSELQDAIEAACQEHAPAEVLAHGRELLNHAEGLWVSLELNHSADAVLWGYEPAEGLAHTPSWVWVFKAHGWFTKYRCTAFAGELEPFLCAARSLMRCIGLPTA